MIRLLVLLAAVLQIATPFVVNPFRGDENAVRGPEPSQIEPAGYAFAIWSVIYAGALAYAVWQLTPKGRADPATARAAPFALLLYLGSTAWLLVVDRGPLWASMPILAAMAACAITVLIQATNAPGESRARFWFATAPFALYAGWTACATFVNVAEAGPQYGFDRFGLTIPDYGALSIAAAVLLAAAVLRLTRGQPLFAATVVWALVAIAAASVARGHAQIITLSAAAGAVVTAAASAAFRRSRPARRAEG